MMKNKKWMVALLAGAMLTSATTASARPAELEDGCQVDADCGEGFVCESYDVGYCEGSTGGPVDGDGMTGDGDGMSGDGEDPGEPMCFEETIKECTPAPPPSCDPAQNSADCGSDVCVSFTFEECSSDSTTVGSGSVPPCEPGAECPEPEPGPAPEPPTCTTQTESFCVPPYLAPCQADNDCGAGFSCVDEVIYEACAAPPPREPGSDMGEDDAPDCSPMGMPTGAKYCELNEVECTSDADCATGLECEEFGGGDAPSIGACSVDEDGTESCDDPAPGPVEPPKSYCVPQNWERWGYATGEDVSSAGGARDAAENLAAPEGQDPDSDGGWKLVESSAARGDADPANPSDPSTSGGGGCASTGTGSAPATGLGLLGLLGMFGLGRRRRRS